MKIDYTQRFKKYVFAQLKSIKKMNPEPSAQQALEMLCKNSGLLTGRIRIPGLNLNMMLKPNEFYLERTVLEIMQEAKNFPLCCSYEDIELKEGTVLGGLCGKIEINMWPSGSEEDESISVKGNTIFIKQGMNRYQRLVARTHEYG
ncbi:MAG: hypothetical protein Q8L27_03420, partial [archaeon]|nr:hypothetical protein [archaeon]